MDGKKHYIYCTCPNCPKPEKLAVVIDGKLVISDRRHGVRHTATIEIAVLDKEF